MAKKKLQQHIIDENWCKRCGICAAFCPKKALEADADGRVVLKRPEDCIACGLCQDRCPDLAIEVVTEELTGS
jgi:2-oxoglutarate ferredoxin oxidoreductase subunit delta